MDKTSVFHKLARMLVLIEIVLLIGVVLLLFRYARVQEQSDRAVREETMSRTMKQLEEQIEAAYGLTESFIKDTRLSRIAYHMYPDDYERSQIILGILDSLYSSDELNASIDGISIGFPGEEVRLSSTSGYNNRALYQAIDADTINNSLLFENGKLNVYIPHPLISSVLGTVPDYNCTVSFSAAYFNSVLTVFGEGKNQGALLVLTDRSGAALSSFSPEESSIEQALLEKVSQTDITTLKDSIYLHNHRLSLEIMASQNYPIALIIWRNTDQLSANIIFTLASLFIIILLTGALLFFMIWQTNRQVAKPIYRLIDAFEQVGKGKLDTRIHHGQNDEFNFIYDSFNRMTERTELLIENIKEQHSLLQNAELMQLQAQIDPHFLYNSFNIIKYMADGEEYEQITEFVSALAQYYRFINKETRQSIPLAAEIDHMETYVYIQQMRFEERIRVEAEKLIEDFSNFMVPKLILQPLVENCYNHGLKNKLENGIISITFFQEESYLYIRVQDNGNEMDEEKLAQLQKLIKSTDDQSVSHALPNIRRRLELAYGEADLLSVSIGELGGLCVTLRFKRE